MITIVLFGPRGRSMRCGSLNVNTFFSFEFLYGACPANVAVVSVAKSGLNLQLVNGDMYKKGSFVNAGRVPKTW